MIIPMLLKIDFGALGRVREHWRGVGVTLSVPIYRALELYTLDSECCRGRGGGRKLPALSVGLD